METMRKISRQPMYASINAAKSGATIDPTVPAELWSASTCPLARVK